MDTSELTRPAPTSTPRTLARIALGAALAGAGITHLTVAREEFRAQVPGWFPVDEDVTVLASGAAEIALGGALVVAKRREGPAEFDHVAVAVFPVVEQIEVGDDIVDR